DSEGLPEFSRGARGHSGRRHSADVSRRQGHRSGAVDRTGRTPLPRPDGPADPAAKWTDDVDDSATGNERTIISPCRSIWISATFLLNGIDHAHSSNSVSRRPDLVFHPDVGNPDAGKTGHLSGRRVHDRSG